MYFDTHVHFDGIKAADGPEGVVKRALAAGVSRMIAVGGSPDGNTAAVSTAIRFADNVYAAVGYDRDWAGKDASFDELSRLATGKHGGSTPVALGEMGLDYHYSAETAREQKALFERQLALACELGIPVIVHSREALDDTVAALRHYSGARRGAEERAGVLHCFTADRNAARRFLDLGFHISFSGIATFGNAREIRDAAAYVPDNRILVETDSPYLSPEPHRGQPNEPYRLPAVAKAIAELRGTEEHAIAELTTRNAERLFGVGCPE